MIGCLHASAGAQRPTEAFGQLGPSLLDTVPWRATLTTTSELPLPRLRLGDRDVPLMFARIRRTDVLVASSELPGGTLLAVLVASAPGHDTLLLAAPRAAAMAPATLDLGEGTSPIRLATNLAPDQPFHLVLSRPALDQTGDWAGGVARLANRLTHWQAQWQDSTTLATDPPQLADDAEAVTTQLLAQLDPGSGLARPRRGTAAILDQLGTLVGLLQTGRHERAGTLLRAWTSAVADHGQIGNELQTPEPVGERVTADSMAITAPTAACWLVIAHYWYLRATQDVTTVRAHWSLLETCVKRLPRQDELLLAVDGDDGGFWRFDAAVLFLHAVACIGGAIDAIDRIEHAERWAHGAPTPRPGAVWNDRFLQLLATFETRFWSEGAGRFTAGRARTGDAAWPDLVTADLLLPAWSGMLTTTGDRTLRNIHTVLANVATERAAPWRSLTPPFADAARVSAEVLIDGPGRFPTLQRMLEHVHRNTAPPSPWLCGLALDAIHHATTGLRVTTGPGIDEDWIRVRPALPPGGRTLDVRGLRHDGWRADLWLEHRVGPLDAEERAANEALPTARRRDPAGDHPRSHFALVLRSADPNAGPRLGVVHCNGTQFQDHLRRDQPLTGSAFADVARAPRDR